MGLKGRGTSKDIGGHGSLGSGLDAVAGEGEVAEQCPEAGDGPALRSVFPGGLAACGAGRRACILRGGASGRAAYTPRGREREGYLPGLPVDRVRTAPELRGRPADGESAV